MPRTPAAPNLSPPHYHWPGDHQQRRSTLPAAPPSLRPVVAPPPGSPGSAEESGATQSPPAARRARWILAAAILAALLRGLFWVAVTEVPSPIDEIHHFAYIESLATGRGIPHVGKDLLTPGQLELMRYSPTLGYREHALDPQKPEEWGRAALSYEGVQPPLYYLTLVPAWYAGRPWGTLGSLYAARVGSVLLALAALPLAWLLARELFPDRPDVWAFAAALPAAVQGFNANLSSVTNDALVVPLAAAALLAIARGVRRPSWRSAAACGAVIGLAMLAKLNAVALLPVLGAGLLLLGRESGRSLWWRLRWGAVASATAGGLAGMWFLWNLAEYGSPNGASAATARILSPLNVSYPLSLEGVYGHFREATRGFWQFERFSPAGPGRYGAVFGAGVLLGLAAWLVHTVRSRSVRDAGAAAWLAACWPLVFGAMLAIVYVAYTSTVVGRHTYPALVALLLFVAAGTLIGLGRPAGTIALACLVAAALWVEQGVTATYVERTYLPHRYLPGVAVAWEQPLNASPVTTSAIDVSAPCPAVLLGLGFAGPPPAEVTVAAAGEAPARAVLMGRNQGFAFYGVGASRPAGPLQVRFDRPQALGAAEEVPGPVTFAPATPGGGLIPMAQIQCEGGWSDEEQFSSRFDRYHWDGISYAGIALWTRAWAIGGIVLALVAAAAAVRRRWDRTGP